MSTTATGTKAAKTPDVLAALASGDPMPLAELVDLAGAAEVAAAWSRGEIELGTTKYVVTGNPAQADLTHNGVVQARPAVVIEGGVEWSGPRQRWHGRLADVLAEKLPVCRAYQKYQLEVCVNREKDVWEWLERPEQARDRDRDTRYARRDIDRAEAERLFGHFARLTDKGLGALST